MGTCLNTCGKPARQVPVHMGKPMTGIHTGGRSPIFSKMAGNLPFLSVYWQISTGYLQVYLPQVFPTDTGISHGYRYFPRIQVPPLMPKYLAGIPTGYPRISFATLYVEREFQKWHDEVEWHDEVDTQRYFLGDGPDAELLLTSQVTHRPLWVKHWYLTLMFPTICSSQIYKESVFVCVINDPRRWSPTSVSDVTYNLSH